MKQLLQKIYRCERENSSKQTITIALLWAAAILAASWLTRGSDYSQELFLILIVLATVSITLPARR